jgi:hypothetical protein
MMCAPLDGKMLNLDWQCPKVFILQLLYLALLLQLIIEGVLVNILIYQTVDLGFVLLNLQLQSGYHDNHID